MALIHCPECGGTVSDKAETCPHCGIKIAGNLDVPATEDVPQKPQVVKTPVQPTPQPAPQVTETEEEEEETYVQPQPTQPIRRPQAQPTGQPRQTTMNRTRQRPVDDTIHTADEQPKKSTTLLIISFFIAIAIFGAGYYFYNNAQTANEEQAYEDAMHSSDPAVLQAFLTRYNDAPKAHRDSVNAHLESLKTADIAWNNACTAGTKKALEEYLKANPNTYHKAEALGKIDSIDYSIAMRKSNTEAYNEYLREHPDGKYAAEIQGLLDDKKSTEVLPAEATLARTVCKHFFQAINSKNESKLLETVSDYLGNFNNHANASSDDVLAFMKKLYHDEDITNMNWHILDDFKVEKVNGADGQSNLKVRFSAEQNIDRTDSAKPHYAKYTVSAEITSDGKIVNFNLNKVEQR